MTPEWQEAVRRGAVAELDALLSRGADIDARDRHGQTAVMLAAIDGHARVVEWLAMHGADLDHTAKFGLSALMLAVVRGHAEVVRVLVAAGASVELKGTGAPGFTGQSAYDLAVARGDDGSAALLQPLEPGDATGPAAAIPRARHLGGGGGPHDVLAAAAGRHPRPRVARLASPRPRSPAARSAEASPDVRGALRRRGGVPVAARRTGCAPPARSRCVTDRARCQIRLAGHEGRGYPLGPEVPADDIDGRSAAVVTWHDGPMFHFVASTQLPLEEVTIVAASLYTPG